MRKYIFNETIFKQVVCFYVLDLINKIKTNKVTNVLPYITKLVGLC